MRDDLAGLEVHITHGRSLRTLTSKLENRCFMMLSCAESVVGSEARR
jgi:hypothetical protein